MLERTRIDVEVAPSAADEPSVSTARVSSLSVDLDAAAGVILRLFANVGEGAANAVRGIAAMRNLATHGRADELTPEMVAEYATLVEATIVTIQQRPRRQSSDGPKRQGGSAA